MEMTDEEAAEHYRKPENQRPSPAPARRRSKPVLTTHVPIRWKPDTIAKVRILARQEQKTVSTWIRDLVEREVESQLPTSPLTGLRGIATLTLDIVFTQGGEQRRVQPTDWESVGPGWSIFTPAEKVG